MQEGVRQLLPAVSSRRQSIVDRRQCAVSVARHSFELGKKAEKKRAH